MPDGGSLCAQWKRIALELDALLGLNQWKQSAPNAYYDAPLVRRVLKALREFRSRDDVEGVCAVLHACVRNNFAGVESFRLYSESYYGTKNLVQEYLDEGESRRACTCFPWRPRSALLLLLTLFAVLTALTVSSSLEYVRGAPPSALPIEEKADFFRSISKNLGASALCLSGGACESTSRRGLGGEKINLRGRILIIENCVCSFRLLPFRRRSGLARPEPAAAGHHGNFCRRYR